MKTRQDVADILERIFMNDITLEKFIELKQKAYEDVNALREAGQKEYAHSSENALRNFEALANDLENVEREHVLWVYLKKHLDGILAYINGHRSQREPIYGRLNDAIVYLILLRAIFEDSEGR